MEAVFERVSRERIYAVTGIQFLPFNTIYQLYAACRATPNLIDAARALVTIPDLLNYWLTGALVAEYTIATTTQMIDARTRTWATRMLDEIELPTRLLQPLVEPGTIIGALQPSASAAVRRHAGRRAGVPRHRRRRWRRCRRRRHVAFLSSGTWSLLGTEVAQPDHHGAERWRSTSPTKAASCGTTRLLKNIGGLWLLQSCRRTGRSQGQDLPVRRR